MRPLTAFLTASILLGIGIRYPLVILVILPVIAIATLAYREERALRRPDKPRALPPRNSPDPADAIFGEMSRATDAFIKAMDQRIERARREHLRQITEDAKRRERECR